MIRAAFSKIGFFSEPSGVKPSRAKRVSENFCADFLRKFSEQHSLNDDALGALRERLELADIEGGVQVQFPSLRLLVQGGDLQKVEGALNLKFFEDRMEFNGHRYQYTKDSRFNYDRLVDDTVKAYAKTLGRNSAFLHRIKSKAEELETELVNEL